MTNEDLPFPYEALYGPCLLSVCSGASMDVVLSVTPTPQRRSS